MSKKVSPNTKLIIKENIRYRHYFTKKSLSELLMKYKFNILEHYEIDEPENNRIWQFVVARKY